MFSIGTATTATTTRGITTKPYYLTNQNQQHNKNDRHYSSKQILSRKWKADLKRSCLERARQKRYELIKSHRSSSINDNAIVADGTFFNKVNDLKDTKDVYLSKGSSPILARQVIQEEIVASKKRMEDNVDGCRPIFEENEKEESEEDNNIMLTEEELLELMHEVEEELDREAKELYFEEIHRVETYDDYLLQNQVNDFEMWQEEVDNNNTNPTPFVPCPMCSIVGLIQENDNTTGITKISCNNCGFCINRKDHDNAFFSLKILQERMRELYESHIGCNIMNAAKFSFSVDVDCNDMSDNYDSCLKAQCNTCGMVVKVL